MIVRYENISKLITQLERSFESQGYANLAHTSTKRLTGVRFLWISGQSVLSRQRGVYRVNCIDCLDRTNVVQASDIFCQSGCVSLQQIQSAFARYVLNRQLLAVALLYPSGHGRTDMDVVFNDGTLQIKTTIRDVDLVLSVGKQRRCHKSMLVRVTISAAKLPSSEGQCRNISSQGKSAKCSISLS